MRPIKFRGKTRDGRWLHGDILHLNNSVCIAPHDGNWYDFMPHQSVLGTPSAEYEVIPETVGQFTGYFDENKQEVYEGDIVRCIAPDGEEYVTTVRYDEGAFAIDVISCDYDYSAIGWAVDVNVEELRVISNIHDSPELLEGGKK